MDRSKKENAESCYPQIISFGMMALISEYHAHPSVVLMVNGDV